MHVVLEDEVRSWSPRPAPRRAPRPMSCLLDLHVPRGEAGAPEVGASLTGAVVTALLEGVVDRAAENGASQLDLAFFGGEPRLDGRLLLELSTRLRRECEYERIGYTGHLVTDGTLLGSLPPYLLASAGLAHIQLTLEDDRGPSATGGGGPGWRHAVERLEPIVGAARVVVRTRAELVTPELQQQLRSLEGDDAGRRGGAITLYLARPAPRCQQARELLKIFPLLREWEDALTARVLH